MLDDAEVLRGLRSFLKPRGSDRPHPELSGDELVAAGRAYLAGAASDGWAVPTWPHHLGGRGASGAESRLIARLRRDFEVPDLYPFMTGLFLVGPALLEWGTEEQRERWMPPIARGEEIWCQMFSEPDAGSDLANLGARAVRDGDEWQLDGQKVWTSRAAYASWGLCLARTDPSAPKHSGITAFVVPMQAAGVTIRPLVQMNGDDHFSEVFVDAVRIPDANRIGEVGQGWRFAMTVLAHERGLGDGGGGRPKNEPERLPSWLAELVEAGRLDDPVVRSEALELYVRERVLRLSTQRVANLARSGQSAVMGSGLKFVRSALNQDRSYFVTRSWGMQGLLDEHPRAFDTLTAPSMSIRGGTDEIQRNIVGERVLGLPPEPRFDRDVPWTVSKAGA